MRFLQNFHLFSGVFFAPLIVVFALSGAWQSFGLHHALKDGSYSPPQFMAWGSMIHTVGVADLAAGTAVPCSDALTQADVDLCEKQRKELLSQCVSCKYFPNLLALLGIGMCVSALSGIVMAFRYTPSKTKVFIVLVSGIAVPLLFIWLQLSLR